MYTHETLEPIFRRRERKSSVSIYANLCYPEAWEKLSSTKIDKQSPRSHEWGYSIFKQF